VAVDAPNKSNWVNLGKYLNRTEAVWAAKP
jgi:hypothetical protein